MKWPAVGGIAPANFTMKKASRSWPLDYHRANTQPTPMAINVNSLVKNCREVVHSYNRAILHHPFDIFYQRSLSDANPSASQKQRASARHFGEIVLVYARYFLHSWITAKSARGHIQSTHTHITQSDSLVSGTNRSTCCHNNRHLPREENFSPIAE